jgi:ABC-2 type transport system permease protein
MIGTSPSALRLARRIAAHEWRLFHRSGLAWIATGLLVCTMAYGVHGGLSMAARHRHSLEQVVQERRARLGSLAAASDGSASSGVRKAEAMDPWTVAYGGHVAALPSTRLASLSIGQSDLLPQMIGVSITNKQRVPEDRYGFENPVHLAVRRFDMSFAVIVLLPLVVITIAYDLLARDREDGTLLLVLSQPVSAGTLLLGKLTPRAVLLAGIPIAIVLATLVGRAPDVLLSGRELLLLCVWVMLVVGYMMFWLGAAALLNLRGSSSAGYRAAACVSLGHGHAVGPSRDPRRSVGCDASTVQAGRRQCLA